MDCAAFGEGGALMTPPVDFASQDFFRDPAAAIEKLRKLGPVLEVRFPIIDKIWTTRT
jgi:cytochrome P450 PksS